MQQRALSVLYEKTKAQYRDDHGLHSKSARNGSGDTVQNGRHMQNGQNLTGQDKQNFDIEMADVLDGPESNQNR